MTVGVAPACAGLSSLPGVPGLYGRKDDTLLAMAKDSTLVAIGKSLGVSDTAVRRHLESRGITPWRSPDAAA